jgi:hypothetical protein
LAPSCEFNTVARLSYTTVRLQPARLGLAAEHPDPYRAAAPTTLYGCPDTEVLVAARQSSGRPQKKPPLTATRYKQMVRELAHLYNKYQGDLDEVIPFMWMGIASAEDRARRMTKSPKAGAPELWNEGQLARLWVKVRALQIVSPGLTVREICRQLVSAQSWSNPTI